MTQPDTLTGLTRRVSALEERARDTRDLLRIVERRSERLEAAMLDQQEALDGIYETVRNVARTQAEHTESLRTIGERLHALDERLDGLDPKLDEILRRLPAPPDAQ